MFENKIFSFLFCKRRKRLVYYLTISKSRDNTISLGYKIGDKILTTSGLFKKSEVYSLNVTSFIIFIELIKKLNNKKNINV